MNYTGLTVTKIKVLTIIQNISKTATPVGDMNDNKKCKRETYPEAVFHDLLL